MAAPLPLPALHATHAGIWLARGDGEMREASRGEAIARAAETPHIILNAPLVGQRLGYPDLSGPRPARAVRLHPPGAVRGADRGGPEPALGLEPPDERSRCGGRAASASPSALLARARRPDWPEREGAWTSNATLHRLGWGWAPLIGARLERPERGERMLFSRLKQWEESGRAAAAADRSRSIPRTRAPSSTG